MDSKAQLVSLSHCPKCGRELPATGWEGLCPRCLVTVSLQGDLPSPASARVNQGSDSEGEPAGLDNAPETDVSGFGNLTRAFGDYELLEEIGRGGMGVVFKARQRSLNRLVAVKILLAGPLASGPLLERFRAEAEAVAQLQHPNIVAIFEAGQCKSTAFFSMEYVPGRTLADLVTERPLPPDLAAQHVRSIAEAIDYAHQHGILHRDLKPSNVLIDASGRPRVTDFGLAKRFDNAAYPTPHSTITLSGQVLGSPSYVAPEQAGASRGQIGPATDIYALGAILYHLSTGRPPFLAESLEATLLQVLTTEPVGVRRLNSAVPRDLETICAKCLQKEPGRRYATAQALGEDLGRFLRHEPIVARPVGALTRLWRWCQRRPMVAVILLLLQLSFAAGLGGILWQWRRAHRSEFSLQQNLYAADVNLAQVPLAENNLGRAAALLQHYVPNSPAQPDLRGFEWRYLWRLCQSDEQVSLPGDGSIVSCVRFSPDGGLLATAGFNQVVSIWETISKRLITRLKGLSGPVCRLALSFSPDGTYLAAAGGTNLLLWKTADWKVVHQLEAQSAPLGGGAYQLAFTPDGKGLAAGLDGDVHVWETASWHGRVAVPGGVNDSPSLLAFSADGSTVATYTHDRVRFWDAHSGRERGQSQEAIGQPFGLFFSPSGDRLAVPDTSGKVRLLDPRTGVTVGTWVAHDGSAQAVAFSPDGKTLATGGADQLVRLWDLDSASNIATFKGHRSEVWSVAFSPDGQTLASGGKDGMVKLWTVRPRSVAVNQLASAECPFWFSTDGKTLVTRNPTGWSHYWDAESGQRQGRIPPTSFGVDRFATTISSDGKLLATGVRDGRIFLWSLETAACIATNRVDANPVNAVAFAPDNQQLALSTGQYVRGCWHGTTKILNLATGQLRTLATDYSGTRDMASVVFSPDGRLLAGVGPNYTIRFWDLATKQERPALKGHTWDVVSLAFSRDGRLLASASNDQSARLWDVARGKQIACLGGHRTGVVQVGFSPEGRTLFTSANDKTIRLWSVATQRELLALKTAAEWPHFVLSPDGHTLATGGMSGPLQLWRAPESN